MVEPTTTLAPPGEPPAPDQPPDAEAPAAVAPSDEQAEPTDELGRPVRLLVAAGLATTSAAVMVGGSFAGWSARFYAVAAGALGVLLADRVARPKRALTVNLLVVVGLVGIGVVLVLPSGLGNVVGLRRVVAEAAEAGDVLRPPVPFTPGWHAILGWCMGTVGFLGGWMVVRLRRPVAALVLPMPVAAFGGISLPEADQVPSGIAGLVLFAMALWALAGATGATEADDKPSVGYELRRAFRALPLVAAITAALVGLANADFLFPEPVVNPAQEAQKPKTVPLSEVQDRTLFEVEAAFDGPWRLGTLDTYDGKDWRLPPFAASELIEVDEGGVVDRELPTAVSATFVVADLGGSVLPGLPNTVGVIARGPSLSYDARTGNIRLVNGQLRPGTRYTVAAAAPPTIDQLRSVTAELPGQVREFLRIPAMPPEVADLVSRAPSTSKWDTFDFIRNHVLDNVVATGPGTPKSVTPDRVADMLAGSKEGSPFEIVAAQAMLARWVGIPSRIGYGFDGGERMGERLHVHPRHAATFVEIFVPGLKWLPVIGKPRQAKASVSPEGSKPDASVLPSDDIAIEVFLPVLLPPKSTFGANVRRWALIGTIAAVLLLLAYVTFPALRKSIARARRRAAARRLGPRARVALAYAEFRDWATDFGYSHSTDTPLMFLARFVPDEEHTQLTWLVTRVCWGDLRDVVDDDHAATAEDLSRSLRKRLAQAQPLTLRAVARVSRASVRHPYAAPMREEGEVDADRSAA